MWTHTVDLTQELSCVNITGWSLGIEWMKAHKGRTEETRIATGSW